MKYLPLLILAALAGCTSSDQGAINPAAPVSEGFAPSSATIASEPPAPAPLGASPVSPGKDIANQPSTVTTVAPSPEATRMAGFPPPPACGDGSSEPECPAARVEKCRTIGSVTTCDVPPNPAADSTHYTN